MTKARKPKVSTEASAELQFKQKVAMIDAILSGWKSFLAVGGAVVIAFFAYRSIAVLAGQSTNSNIMIQFVTDLKANKWFPLVFGGAFCLYGMGERKLRQQTTKRMHKRIKELEERVDPERTSSGLTTTGETRPEDDK